MTEETLEWLKLCLPEERLQFFSALFEVYCRHCGYPQPAKRTCQCWNDE